MKTTLANTIILLKSNNDHSDKKKDPMIFLHRVFFCAYRHTLITFQPRFSLLLFESKNHTQINGYYQK